MNTKSNKMFMTRRKAIAGILATGVGLSINFATAPSSFAASLSSSDVHPTALKMKATITNSQVQVKTSKIAGKNGQAALKNYTLKTNTQHAPLVAADTTATFTRFPITTTSDPGLASIVKGDDGSSFFFTENGSTATRIGKITTQGAITEYLLPQDGIFSYYDVNGIANGPGDSFWFTYSQVHAPVYIGKLVSASGQVTLYNIDSGDDFDVLSDITRGPHDPLWYVGGKVVGCIYPDGQYTNFQPDIEGRNIVAGSDGALWFTYADDNGYGVARITTSGDLTYYPLPDQTFNIVAGDQNDLWFTQQNNHINRITTSGQLTQYQLTNVSSHISAPQPGAIARVASGTYAFGAFTTALTSGDGKGTPTYMGTITTAGDVTLYQQPNSLDIPVDAVYAGWANEVWYTVPSAVYKFRLNS